MTKMQTLSARNPVASMQAHDVRSRLIRRILRVNHAGEHGAVSIYGAQIHRIGGKYPDLQAWLAETLTHELAHRASFKAAMPSRFAKPCRALGVWKVGGWLLGSATASLGRTGVMVCTAAVERTVHAHLEEQIGYLSLHDPQLAVLVQDIQREERSHLDYAQSRLPSRSILVRFLFPLVEIATELLIAISTRGDSFRLRRTLRANFVP